LEFEFGGLGERSVEIFGNGNGVEKECFEDKESLVENTVEVGIEKIVIEGNGEWKGTGSE
jgi:hypothetical protein